MAIFAFVTYATMGGLFAGLSIPLLRSKIPPNQWYGFRTRLTLSDPRIWYPVNVWGARRLLWLGVGTLLAGPVSLLGMPCTDDGDCGDVASSCTQTTVCTANR